MNLLLQNMCMAHIKALCTGKALFFSCVCTYFDFALFGLVTSNSHRKLPQAIYLANCWLYIASLTAVYA